MKYRLLLSLVSTFILLGCSTPHHLEDKSGVISLMQQRLPEEICADKFYRVCAGDITYSNCINEQKTYEPICTRKSFSTKTGPVTDKDFYEASLYGVCITIMHLEDHSIEQTENLKCKERYEGILSETPDSYEEFLKKKNSN